MAQRRGSRKRFLLFRTLALAGVAWLALAVSQAKPRDPLIDAADRFLAGLDPARAGQALGLAMQAWVFLSGFAIVAYLAYSSIEAFRGKTEPQRKRAFRQRMRDPLFAAVAWLAALGLVAGGVYAVRAGAVAVERRLDRNAAAPSGEPAPAFEPGAEPSTGEPPPTAGEMYESAPSWIRWVLASLLGAATAASVILAAMRADRRNAPAPEPAVSDSLMLAEGIAEAHRRLHVADDVRDAIISAYADMCALFADDRHGRPGNLTPREFADRLRSDGAAETEISSLTGLFEKARYSGEPCLARDREEAGRCLAALIDMYRGREGS